MRIGCTPFAIVLLGGCAGELSVLAPQGPVAAQVAQLWWVMLVGASAILAGVMALALYAFLPSPRAGPAPRYFLFWGGIVFPVVTLTALLVWALMRGEELVARQSKDLLTVEAHSAQWFWTFSYPDGETTQGVLHVPAGETFLVRITSADVIHSFWVPRLGGKMDAVPGKTNILTLKADHPGVYRGACAEYCGIGHTQMAFEIHVHPGEDYAAILADAVSGAPPSDMFTPRAPPVSEEIGKIIRGLLGGEDSQ